MNLDTYLREINACPDKLVAFPDRESIPMLTAEYGVYDNYYVLFKSPKDITEELSNVPGFSFLNTVSDKSGLSTIQHNLTGDSITICSNPNPELLIGATTGGALNTLGMTSERILAESKKQTQLYSAFFMLHYPKKFHSNDICARVRPLVKDIQAISGYLVNKKIPFCFPNSMGLHHREDVSRIVYYIPKEDKK